MGDLHDVEILLSDQVSFHPQPELVAARGRKNERRDIDAEIRNLQAVRDHDVGERGAAHQLLAIEVHKIDVEPVQAFSIREAEVQPHLLVLERKVQRLQVREQADQAFFLGDAVLDHLIADEERLDAGLDDL